MTQKDKDVLKAFGVELTPCELKKNTYDIDINVSFDDYAIYFNVDFSNKVVVSAHICEFKPVKKYGVIPTDSPADGVSRFDCCVGEYSIDEAQVVLKDNNRDVFDFYAKIAGFDEYENYSITAVIKKNLNEFIPYSFDKQVVGYYGFFNSLNVATEKMNEIRKSQMYSLSKKLEAMSWFSFN